MVPLPKATPRMLKKLRAESETYFKNYVAKGGKVTTFKCPHCKDEQKTIKPTAKDVGAGGEWRGVVTCTNCGKMCIAVRPTRGKATAFIP